MGCACYKNLPLYTLQELTSQKMELFIITDMGTLNPKQSNLYGSYLSNSRSSSSILRCWSRIMSSLTMFWGCCWGEGGGGDACCSDGEPILRELPSVVSMSRSGIPTESGDIFCDKGESCWCCELGEKLGKLTSSSPPEPSCTRDICCVGGETGVSIDRPVKKNDLSQNGFLKSLFYTVSGGYMHRGILFPCVLFLTETCISGIETSYAHYCYQCECVRARVCVCACACVYCEPAVLWMLLIDMFLVCLLSPWLNSRTENFRTTITNTSKHSLKLDNNNNNNNKDFTWNHICNTLHILSVTTHNSSINKSEICFNQTLQTTMRHVSYPIH